MEKVHIGGGIFPSCSPCFTLHVKLEMAKYWLRNRQSPTYRRTLVNVRYPQISLKQSLKFESGLERSVTSNVKTGIFLFLD